MKLLIQKKYIARSIPVVAAITFLVTILAIWVRQFGLEEVVAGLVGLFLILGVVSAIILVMSWCIDNWNEDKGLFESTMDWAKRKYGPKE